MHYGRNPRMQSDGPSCAPLDASCVIAKGPTLYTPMAHTLWPESAYRREPPDGVARACPWEPSTKLRKKRHISHIFAAFN